MNNIHGDTFIEELQRTHRCSEDCWECRQEREAWIIKPISRWNSFTESESALRIGYAVKELGVTFPIFSEDALEQFLIEESVLKSYHDFKLRTQKDQLDKEEAERVAQEGLQAFRQQQGFI